MRRGKSQVLYRYLPHCIVDFADNHTIVKITKWNTRPIDGINKTRLSAEIARRTTRYRNKRVYPHKITSENIVFLEPLSIESELFPLTMQCRGCGLIMRFSSIDHFNAEMHQNLFKCKKCGGKLQQLDLIQYHKCGKAESLAVRGCPSHGYGSIILNKGNSDEPKKWRWHCIKCNRDIGDISPWCNDCNERMDVAPFRKSQVFYPHSLTIINTQGFTDARLYDDIASLKLIIATHLGLIGYEDINKYLNSSEKKGEDSELIKKINKLRAAGMPENYIQMISEEFQDSSFEDRQNVVQDVDRYLPVDHNEIEHIGMHVQEYIETVKLPGSRHLITVMDEARAANDPKWSTIKHFPAKIDDIGIANSYVVSDLPIISAIFGYSRSSLDPNVCTLRSFENSSYPGKIPIYANSSVTEGIVFEFDRWKIIKWLQINNLINEIPENSDIALKSWFLNTIKPSLIPVYDEISPDTSKVTKFVYSLIHSISHTLLRRATGQSGLDKDSLGEIILPNIPAVIIYSNNIHDFQIGGLHTLFESGIIPWIDMAVQDVEKCLYDPVCIDSTGSCHACLQISEISCVHFNRDLGRQYLIGGNIQNKHLIGFWDKSFIRMF